MSPDTVAIIGSGFAGTILARALRARGREVVLLERARHPRFALGESSTPLAAITLERLADEYGLSDLRALAAYGRWGRELPGVRRGLKRGFSFYAHRPGEPYVNGPRNDARLLVAASPDDEVADAHWDRADVDHHLVRRARDEGVEVLEGFDVERVVRRGKGWRISGIRGRSVTRLDAEFIVDGTGSGEVIARALEIGRRAPREPSTGLVFGHFTGVRPLEDSVEAGLGNAPYPEERAAVHHLLDEGWMYVLPFDDGRVSAGFVIDRADVESRRLLRAPAGTAWSELLGRYPTLARQFGAASAIIGPRTQPILQRGRERAAGPGWTMLPHTFAFLSPMFSTGIAWSLVAVERLARALGAPAADGERRLAVEAYAYLLDVERRHLERLIGPAYRLRGDFAAFTAWTYLYFAAASFAEAWQRLDDPPGGRSWTGVGFLGAGDPVLRRAIRQMRCETLGAANRDDPERRVGLERRAAELIRPRNVAGLADPDRNRCYPVDFDDLLDGAARLGFTRREARERLSRLRSPA